MIAETSTVRTDVLQSRTVVRRGSTQDACSLYRSQLLKLILEVHRPFARTSRLPGFHALTERTQIEQADVILLVRQIRAQTGYRPFAIRRVPLNSAVQQGAGGDGALRCSVDHVREGFTLVRHVEPRRKGAPARDPERIGGADIGLELRLTDRAIAVGRIAGHAIRADRWGRDGIGDCGATNIGPKVLVLEPGVSDRGADGQFADGTRVDFHLIAVDIRRTDVLNSRIGGSGRIERLRVELQRLVFAVERSNVGTDLVIPPIALQTHFVFRQLFRLEFVDLRCGEGPRIEPTAAKAG